MYLPVGVDADRSDVRKDFKESSVCRCVMYLCKIRKERKVRVEHIKELPSSILSLIILKVGGTFEYPKTPSQIERLQ